MVVAYQNRKIRREDCEFMTNLIKNIKQIITDSCVCEKPVGNGKTVTNALEYDTIAAESEVVTVTIEGFIIYLYEKAYNDPYPTTNLTSIEKERIYEIYDALKIPRPLL